MPNELADFGLRVAKITDDATLKRIGSAAGMAGKKASMAAAASDLGADRAFSGMRRRVYLGVGFDERGTMVQMNYRPAGLWMLAERGRAAGKPVLPRKRGGSKRAVLTPQGPRARSTTGFWGGKGTWTAAVRDSREAIPPAASKQFSAEVAKIVRH